MKEAEGPAVAIVIAGAIFVALVWNFLFVVFFLATETHVTPVLSEDMAESMARMPILSLLAMLFLFALLEELIFRSWLGRFREWDDKWGAAIVSSLIFGAIHGNLPHVILQGGSGLLYAYVFLKCGGGHGNSPKGLAASTGAHCLFNLICFLPAAFLA